MYPNIQNTLINVKRFRKKNPKWLVWGSIFTERGLVFARGASGKT